MKSQRSRLAQSIEKAEQQKRASLRAAGRSPDLNQQLHKVQGFEGAGKSMNLIKRYGNNPVREFRNTENKKGKKKNLEYEFTFKRVSTRWNSEQIREHINAIASELEINPRLALNVARIESGLNPNIVSPKGAIGIFQVMPKFALIKYNVTQEMLFHPQINIRVGLSMLKALLDRFNNDVDLSLAAYNAGASRVVKAGYKIPSIKETQNYVRKVKKALEDNA